MLLCAHTIAFAQAPPLRPRFRFLPSRAPRIYPHKCHFRATLRISSAAIPMVLTYARLVAIPLLATAALAPCVPNPYLTSSLIFAAASVTDFFDGYLARRWNVVSPLGTFLDPVADKLMVAVALTIITARLPHPSIILSTAIIVSREIFVSALREWMAILGKSAQVQVSMWGKIKTATQMLSITLLLASATTKVWYASVGLLLLIVAAVLAVTSAADYVRSALRAINHT